MGREIKRVEANFDWPMGDRWKGYEYPDDGRSQCIDCSLDDREATGLNSVGRALQAMLIRQPEHYNFRKHFRRHPMSDIRTVERLAADGLLSDMGYFKAHPLVHTDSKDVDEGTNKFLTILEEWYNNKNNNHGKWKRSYTRSLGMMDTSRVLYDLLQLLADSLGSEKEELFYCETCAGDGSIVTDPEQNKIYENFGADDQDPSIGPVYHHPPEGDWWQVWETVSEGSPVTPAFSTAAELIDYLVDKGDLWCQGRPDENPPSLKAATEFVTGQGFVPSMIMVNGKITTGISIAEEL